MVLRVCWQILGDRHHAEDAFQAVFLVLARKATSIRDPDLLSGWLYGVAIRTARKAHARLARLRRNEEGDSMNDPRSGSCDLVDSSARSAAESAIAREQAAALHDEIDRLPKSFRLPVVLCYFEDVTLDEAARRLQWPAGTVRSRLARARDKVRRRLVRRGVVLPAAALAAALSPRSASASVSSALCDTTAKAAIRFTAGHAVSPAVALLAREVLKSMFANKLRITGLSLSLFGALATGASLLEPRDGGPGTGPEYSRRTATAFSGNFKESGTGAGRMTVIGSVLDPAGKPLAGLPVELIGRPRHPSEAGKESWSPYALLGRGATGADGRFRFDAVRTSRVGFMQIQVLAAAPGYGLGWSVPNPDAAQPTGEIRLRPEQIIRCKLIDLNGKPADGVELRVQSLTRHDNIRGDDFIGTPMPAGVGAWPGTVKTGADGLFTLAGIGGDMTVILSIRDPRFAIQTIQIETTDPERMKDLRYVLLPPTFVEGRALAADTGQPIPHAIVTVGSSINWPWSGAGSYFPADEQGRFRANVAPGRYYSIRAYPPEGQPYLIPELRFEWTKGAMKTVMDVVLPRGVLIHGKVVEHGTGRPLAGASVQYYANPRSKDVLGEWHAIVASKSDGSYQIAVSPGKGHLLVFGPTPDYILHTVGSRELSFGRPGGSRIYAHDIISYEVEPGDRPRELVAVLRPSETVRGRIVGPDGQPVESAVILTRLNVVDTHPSWRGAPKLYARDGQFELHGLDPEKRVPVIFYDADHTCGTTVELSGKQAGDDLTVRLQPNGRARARFVGPDGRPIAAFALGRGFQILVTPGPPNLTDRSDDQPERLAEAADMANIDQRITWTFPRPTSVAASRYPTLFQAPSTGYATSRPRTSPARAFRSARTSPSKPAKTSTWVTS